MAGIGSTNAMKKGSGNNPFLAFSEADMRTFLNSAYVGCIVKYTGEAIQRDITDTNRTVEEYAQNIVFKNYAFPEYGLTDGASINIFEKDAEGNITESYIVNGAIKGGVFYYDKSSISTPYVDVLAWVDAKANKANVKAVLYDSVYRWHKESVNDQQMITLWSYSDDVTFTVTGDNLDVFVRLMYVEPYKVGELYKVVYGDGEYYFEEYYYTSEYKTTGNSDYLAPGKTMYDFTGELQTGNGSKVNPYIASTVDEMATYLTSSYKGAFVKYTGETIAVGGGTPAPVNPIAVGDILQSTAEGDEGHPILYLNTDITPDFSQFSAEQLENEEGYPLISVVENATVNIPLVYARKMVQGDDIVYAIIATQILYAYSDTMSPSVIGFSSWGWQTTSPVSINGWGGEAKVTAVNQQDIWGAYISKDGQWTSGGGESYVKNAVYQVAEDGDTTMYMVLPSLDNEGTAADLAEGKELINSNGEKIVGTASGGATVLNGTITPTSSGKSLVISGIEKQPVSVSLKSKYTSSDQVVVVYQCNNNIISKYVTSKSSTTTQYDAYATFTYNSEQKTLTIKVSYGAFQSTSEVEYTIIC